MITVMNSDGTAAALPLRICLLSGGASRRMGQDKALLPHPAGGTWLEHCLRLLAGLQAPITLLSRHDSHLQLARDLNRTYAAGRIVRHAGRSTGASDTVAPALSSSTTDPQAGALPDPIHAIAEPAPWQGPLLALHRLMELHRDQRLLLCPVDMPALTLAALRDLLAAAAAAPALIHVAHDGQRSQPLLGLYPSTTARCDHLAASLAAGERRLQAWLTAQAHRNVILDPRALRNVNRPQECPREWQG
jgi:molybdopterin-guanine dinucleotide biosynthesis protein A